MHAPAKSLILAAAMLTFGAARIPFESSLHGELDKLGLFPPRMDVTTRERIGQTSAAVALGGLRTLVATFLNLRAFTYFTEQRWDDVAATFHLIVDLAPRTRYYWETGAWHMAYNAASYYLADSPLPPLRRREAWRNSIHNGRAFLERGIRNNPDDWSLHANLGALLSDPNKFPAFKDVDLAFAAAAEAYDRAARTGNAPPYVRRSRLYALARVPGRETEALAIARSLYAESVANHTPTLLILLLVLEAHEDPDMDPRARAVELFGTPNKAYEALSRHWQRTRERFPVHGVAQALKSLEAELGISESESILTQPLPQPLDPDSLFNN